MSKYFSILFCLSFLFATCGKDEASSITKLDQGKIVTVQVKKDFSIMLKANPSTGYDWQILDIDSNIIRHKGTSYNPYRNVPGSNGMEQITFTSIKKGTSPLKLGYMRAWEGRGSMVDSFAITVKVK